MFWFVILALIATGGIVGTAIWDEKTNHNSGRDLHDIDISMTGNAYKHSMLYTRFNNGPVGMNGLLGQDMSVTAYDESEGLMRFASEKRNDMIVMGGVHVRDNLTIQPQGLFKARISGVDVDVTGNWFLVPRVHEQSKRDVTTAGALVSKLATIQNANDLVTNVTTSVSIMLEEFGGTSSLQYHLDDVVKALLDSKIVRAHGPDAVTRALRSAMDTTDAVPEDTMMDAAMRHGLAAAQGSRAAAQKVIDMVFERKFSVCERGVGPCEKDLFAELEL